MNLMVVSLIMNRQCMVMNCLKRQSLSYVDDCNVRSVIQWLVTLGVTYIV